MDGFWPTLFMDNPQQSAGIYISSLWLLLPLLFLLLLLLLVYFILEYRVWWIWYKVYEKQVIMNNSVEKRKIDGHSRAACLELQKPRGWLIPVALFPISLPCLDKCNCISYIYEIYRVYFYFINPNPLLMSYSDYNSFSFDPLCSKPCFPEMNRGIHLIWLTLVLWLMNHLLHFIFKWGRRVFSIGKWKRTVLYSGGFLPCHYSWLSLSDSWFYIGFQTQLGLWIFLT